MKPQHDSNNLATSLQISAAIGFEVHRKTIDDHTSNPERSAAA